MINLVPQRTSSDCSICCVSMLTNIPYETLASHIIINPGRYGKEVAIGRFKQIFSGCSSGLEIHHPKENIICLLLDIVKKENQKVESKTKFCEFNESLLPCIFSIKTDSNDPNSAHAIVVCKEENQIRMYNPFTKFGKRPYEDLKYIAENNNLLGFWYYSSLS